jgi:hypothetical protein
MDEQQQKRALSKHARFLQGLRFTYGQHREAAVCRSRPGLSPIPGVLSIKGLSTSIVAASGSRA